MVLDLDYFYFNYLESYKTLITAHFMLKHLVYFDVYLHLKNPLLIKYF